MNGGKVTFFISVMIHILILNRPGSLEKPLSEMTNEARHISLRIVREKPRKDPIQAPLTPSVKKIKPTLTRKMKVPEKRPTPTRKQIKPKPVVILIPVPTLTPTPEARLPSRPVPMPPTKAASSPSPKIIETPPEIPMKTEEIKQVEIKTDKPGQETQTTESTDVVKQITIPEEIRVSYRNLIGGYQVMPRYPISARREGREGTALLRVLVMEDGHVGEVVIIGSSHFWDLDEAAEEAVSQWHFKPALRNGKPVRQSALLPIRFALE